MPFFSAIVLFKSQPNLPRVFGGFLERLGSLGRMGKLPLEQWKLGRLKLGMARNKGSQNGSPHKVPRMGMEVTPRVVGWSRDPQAYRGLLALRWAGQQLGLLQLLRQLCNDPGGASAQKAIEPDMGTGLNGGRGIRRFSDVGTCQNPGAGLGWGVGGGCNLDCNLDQPH